MMEKIFYIYILTNTYNTVLYIGITNDLARRLIEHRNGEIKGFTKHYNLWKLVHVETISEAPTAIAREKQLKGWLQKKKIALIETSNPEWCDLAVEFGIAEKHADDKPHLWKTRTLGGMHLSPDPSASLRMTSQTTIQFYHLLSTSRARAVPKLMEKVLGSGARAVMLASDDATLKTMSDALWSNDPASFIPHGGVRDCQSSEQPIYLTLADENPNGAEILCVLDGSLPASVSTYSKLLDVFDGSNEDEVANARKRWAYYKEKGFALQYVKQQPGGGWKVEMTQEAAA